jgi:hypothetical protein
MNDTATVGIKTVNRLRESERSRTAVQAARRPLGNKEAAYQDFACRVQQD